MNKTLFLANLIHHQRSLGLVPTEIHAERDTLNTFAHKADLKPIVPPDKRSLIARIRFPNDGPAPRLEFEGLPLVVNAEIPAGAIILRPLQSMGNPHWVRDNVRFGEKPETATAEPQGGLQAMPADGSTPWHQNSQGEAQEAPEGALAQLGASGGISPTDVVMKSLDGIEGVKDIVILRFRKSGDVEMTSTLDRLAIAGALQIAMGYVLRGE